MPETDRSRKPLFRALLAVYVVVAALVIGALAGEVVLRLQRRSLGERSRGYREKNVFVNRALGLGTPDSLWLERWVSYKPNARLKTKTYDLRTNSFGYRTHEFTVEKPEGRLRVLCIGASTTVQGNRNDTTYPAVLQQLLRERFPERDIEVLNLGISGSFSDYWLGDDDRLTVSGRRRIDWLLELAPDVVIQYNGTNDLVRRDVPIYAREHPHRVSLMHGSLLYERLFPPEGSDFDRVFDETLKHLGEIHAKFREHGVDYLVGAFAGPDYDRASRDFQAYLDLTTEEWTGGTLRYYSEYKRLMESFNTRLLEYAAREGMSAVEVHKSVTEPKLFMDICHMNDAGIREMAGAFVAPAAQLLAERAANAPESRP